MTTQIETPEPAWLKAWVPNSEQIRWFQEFIAKAHTGTIWHVPATNAEYRIDKEAKTFTLTAGDPTDDWHWMNKKLLAMLGYTIQSANWYGTGKTCAFSIVLTE